jgi:hypothetical protein
VLNVFVTLWNTFWHKREEPKNSYYEKSSYFGLQTSGTLCRNHQKGNYYRKYNSGQKMFDTGRKIIRDRKPGNEECYFECLCLFRFFLYGIEELQHFQSLSKIVEG